MDKDSQTSINLVRKFHVMPLTTVEISKKNLLHNINQFKKILGNRIIMPVVKSNAYGHGIQGVAKLLNDKAPYLVVVSLEEALKLRESGITANILALGNVDVRETDLFKQALQYDTTFGVYHKPLIKTLNSLGASLKKRVRVHLKIDTGMSRFGVFYKDAAELIVYARRSRWIIIEGIYSHLACADEDTSFTEKQCQRFEKVINFAEKQKLSIPYIHIANTAGSFLEHVQGNACRVGLGIYGLYPSDWSKKLIEKRFPKFNLKPVLTWKTTIMQVKELPPYTGVSYGCTYITKKRTTCAVLPIGYSDGLGRALSNKGEVLVKGVRCPILGRVCMNQTVIDVSKVSASRIGDEAIIIGASGKEHISADEIALKTGTINYEIVTRINPLLPRLFQ